MAQVQPAPGVLNPSAPYTPGVAPVRPEYVVSRPQIRGGPSGEESASKPVADSGNVETQGDEPDDDAAERFTALDPPDAKRAKLTGAARRRAKKEARAAQVAAEKAEADAGGNEGTPAAAAVERSGQRGQNKNRKFGKLSDENEVGLCDSVVKGGAEGAKGCRFGDKCKYEHDVQRYLLGKKRDLLFPSPPKIVEGDYKNTVRSKEGEERRNIKLEELGLLRPIATSSTEGLAKKAEEYLDVLYSSSKPFVKWSTHTESPSEERKEATAASKDVKQSLLHTSPQTHCAAYHQLGGQCPAGWRCRFLGAHVRVQEASESSVQQNGIDSAFQIDNVQVLGAGLFEFSKANQDKQEGDSTYRLGEYNWLSGDGMRALRKREFPLPRTAAVLARLAKENNNETRPKPIVLTTEEIAKQEKIQEERIKERMLARADGDNQRGKKGNGGKRKASEQEPKSAAPAEEDLDEMMNDAPAAPVAAPAAPTAPTSDGLFKDTTSIDTARIRPSEKRRLNWKGELYLAPLTTTGNLPFRKLCFTFGSDIHCGEMGLAESYLQGNSSEWSLVRRWEGERVFGTQLCGSRPELLVPVAEALYKECGPNGLDFVDLNCGCPIDLVYNKGAGSALMDHAGRLGKILRGMSAVLGEIPVTIKMRTGTSNKVNTAHKLFARVQTEFGVGAATLHGRSRQQRYKNLADWSYIKQCAETLRSTVREHNESAFTADEEEMVPIPIYGNGDVYSYEDYYTNLEHTGVDGEMIARGALIKPWLFTEIKEKRSWDISSRERLDMIRQYASYGLTHWGSDTAGVNLTRRFLCEALSFWHRYVPVGLLEYLPPRMNDRPPVFRGRDELETFLASGNAQDWVKISEMFLGKAPEDWNFIPKHKSNSFNDSGGDNQG